MASYIQRRKFLAALGGAATARAQQPNFRKVMGPRGEDY
jgi:hypothetical protein